MVCVPHPFDIFRINRLKVRKEILNAIDCIEVVNSRCMSIFNKKASKLAQEKNFCITAGSDAHSSWEIGTSGVIVATLEDLKNPRKVKIFGTKIPIWKILKR